MIELRNASFRYSGANRYAIANASVKFASGEFALLAGATGSGKSTLLRLFNGLAPHFTGGVFEGEVLVDGRDMTRRMPHDFAHLVGYVAQLAEASFVADTPREELAFGMEQLGVSVSVMTDRIARISRALQLEEVLDQPLGTLSGGFQQRVAVAASLVAGQQVLLLDEPTSELDDAAASSLVQLLQSLAHRTGVTVIVAEHRLDRLLPLVDSLTVVTDDGAVTKTDERQEFEVTMVAHGLTPLTSERQQRVTPKSRLLLTAKDLGVEFDGKPVLSGVSLSLTAGTITGVYGSNGSGKSSLLWALQGHLKSSGEVYLFTDAAPRSPGAMKPRELLAWLAMVPQSASDLLILHSVSEELAESDAFANSTSGSSHKRLIELAGDLPLDVHPRDLSSGQQLALALTLQLNKGASVILLDEPTRGLDYRAREVLRQQLEALASAGHAILLASHDSEFIAHTAHATFKLEAGTLMAGTPMAGEAA